MEQLKGISHSWLGNAKMRYSPTMRLSCLSAVILAFLCESPVAAKFQNYERHDREHRYHITLYGHNGPCAASSGGRIIGYYINTDNSSCVNNSINEYKRSYGVIVNYDTSDERSLYHECRNPEFSSLTSEILRSVRAYTEKVDICAEEINGKIKVRVFFQKSNGRFKPKRNFIFWAQSDSAHLDEDRVYWIRTLSNMRLW